MKKNYKAKLQGEFDIIQLTEDNYDEVVAFLEKLDFVLTEFSNRNHLYIEFVTSDGHLYGVEKNNYVFVDPNGEFHVMSKTNFEDAYEEI
jgi:hypothetical protein